MVRELANPNGRLRLCWDSLPLIPTYAVLAARDPLGWVPTDVREALETLAQLNAARNRRLRVVLRETASILNRAGFEPLLPDQ